MEIHIFVRKKNQFKTNNNNMKKNKKKKNRPQVDECPSLSRVNGEWRLGCLVWSYRRATVELIADKANAG